MLTRLLFILLLAANIGVGLWLYLAPRQAQPAPPQTDPGVAPIVLLAEREAGSPIATAELASPPETPEQAARDRCLRLGPFPTQADLRRAMNLLTPVVKRIQFREATTTQSRGFFVYLPAPPTREEALAIARNLSGRGVRDYYVVTAGDQQNTISLGLFRTRANAERRRDEVAALGFTPQLVERTEQLPSYWLDFAVDPDSTLDWRDLLPDLLDIRDSTIDCF